MGGSGHGGSTYISESRKRLVRLQLSLLRWLVVAMHLLPMLFQAHKWSRSQGQEGRNAMLLHLRSARMSTMIQAQVSWPRSERSLGEACVCWKATEQGSLKSTPFARRLAHSLGGWIGPVDCGFWQGQSRRCDVCFFLNLWISVLILFSLLRILQKLKQGSQPSHLELVGASGAAMRCFFCGPKHLPGVLLAGGSWATCVHVGGVGVVLAIANVLHQCAAFRHTKRSATKN